MSWKPTLSLALPMQMSFLIIIDNLRFVMITVYIFTICIILIFPQPSSIDFSSRNYVIPLMIKNASEMIRDMVAGFIFLECSSFSGCFEIVCARSIFKTTLWRMTMYFELNHFARSNCSLNRNWWSQVAQNDPKQHSGHPAPRHITAYVYSLCHSICSLIRLKEF